MQLVLRNDLAEMERLAAAVSDFCEAHALPPEAAFHQSGIGRAGLGASVEDRQIGGLGVHFLRTLMHDLSYHRNDGRNHLSFRKPL